VSKTTISLQQVQHIAKLANLTLDPEQEKTFPHAFEDTLAVVEQLKELDVSHVEPTHQVTGLENVLREDVVVAEYMFTQKQALANAPQHHEGYFVVPQIIDKDD
jgi:aspartyl-tRNA(Asn)/glutamyl-tRNA(Gln) amidotransferase subunit C